VEEFNSQLDRWIRHDRPGDIDDFVKVDEKVLKWIRRTKKILTQEKHLKFAPKYIRESLYRPFTRQFYFFHRGFSEDIYQFPKLLPTPETQAENKLLVFSGIAFRA
jgi:predicted helicase